MVSPVLYYGPFSDLLLNQLECCLCSSYNYTTLPQVKSKCRELVRTDSLIMAAPNTSVSKEFYVIGQRGYVGSKTSQLNVELLRLLPVTLSLLQICYEFTLKARLAPKWNEIDEWLVKGNDVFVTGRTQGLNVGFNRSEVTLSITAVRLTFNLLKPQHLEVSTSVLTKFINESTAVINETSISCNMCRVLPNLTPAYVYSVSHSLPLTSSSFDSYDKIRLHWKKQYGYVLPLTQSLFYQIFFKFNTTSFLSYPGSCVVRGTPIAVACRDREEILAAFINDIHTRVPILCGNIHLTFSERPRIPLATLKPFTSTIYPHNTKPVAMTIPKPSHVTLGVPNIPSVREPSTVLGTVSRQAVPSNSTVLGKRSVSQPASLEKRSFTDHTVPDTNDCSSIVTNNDCDLMYQKIEASKMVTLKSWLQDNGVRYHSKDKKDKLIKLVYEQVKVAGKIFK